MGALILDAYLEQLDTRASESDCSMKDAFHTMFYSEFTFLPLRDEPGNILNAIYRMPVKDWWHKYGFTADREDYPAPTNDHYFV